MTSPYSLSTYLRACARRLDRGGADAPRLCAELLLAEALGLERMELVRRILLHPDDPAPVSAVRHMEALLERRLSGEPAAYLLGRKEFFGRDFLVNRATLIPRPETELLVETALELAPKATGNHPPRFADLGTGSGCIAVTLALELSGWRGLAVERSAAALDVARSNARCLRAPRLAFIRSDFTLPLFRPCSLDLVASNPPYVSAGEYAALQREVRDFEPASALVPDLPAARPEGADGTEHARRIIREAAVALRPGGWLVMEMGCGQGATLLHALGGPEWTGAHVRPDLAGLDRLVAAQKS